MHLVTVPDREAQQRLDFEAAKTHELFDAWWSTWCGDIYPPSDGFEPGGKGGRPRRAFALGVFDVPLDLAMALLLSFFICIDFPGYAAASTPCAIPTCAMSTTRWCPRCRASGCSWARRCSARRRRRVQCDADVSRADFSGCRARHAARGRGLCALPRAHVRHDARLGAAGDGGAVQPGGGLALAAKVTAAVTAVVTLETFVFSPKILGRMMDLHPVVVIALLPLAQYFFGVWGLILATPVAVFVINHFILKDDRELAPQLSANDSLPFPRPDR